MAEGSIKELKAYYRSKGKEVLSLPKTNCCRQIILIRHGEPDLPVIRWGSRKDAVKYFIDYDKAGILRLKERRLSFDKLHLRHVFSSPTPRAFHTVKVLFKDQLKIIADDRFREFERKIFSFPDISFSLPLKFWTIFSRVLWLFGFNSEGIETRVEAYKRAKENAFFLIEDAEQHGNTILVAHGFHNKVLADFLKRSGWKMVSKEGSGYGAVNILAKEI